MATIQTDLSEIARAVNENKQPFKTADEKNLTELEFVKYNRSWNFVFGEYIRAGWRFSLAAGIDFSASNGFIKDPSSLHYVGEERPDDQNLYLKVMTEILTHVQSYIVSNNFPVFGFGGIPKHMGYTSV